MANKRHILKPIEVAALSYLAGLRNQGLIISVAVCDAESGRDATAKHKNVDGSTDYGLWQINSVHKQYQPEELLNPGGNAVAMKDISSNGRNWTPWVTFTTGRYLPFMPEAGLAVKAMQKKGADKVLLDMGDVVGVTSGGGDFFSGLPGVNSIPGVSDAKAAAEGVASFTGAVGDFVGKLTDPHTWYRVAQVVLGAIIFSVGLYMMFKGGVPDLSTVKSKIPGKRKKAAPLAGDTFKAEPAPA